VLLSCDGAVYQFKEGYVRTSSEPYTLDEANFDQIYVHLTNNAVQKYSKSYGKFEEANIVSVQVLADELAATFKMSPSQFKEKLYDLSQQIIIDSIQAAKHLLKFHKNSFELVGYDLMIINLD
jgi:tubulin---tyrosine ligase